MSEITVSEPVPEARELSIARSVVVFWSLAAGVVLSVVWSASFVDGSIGQNVAGTLLGHDAKTTAISSGVAGAVFAFVSGLAGTFTACNIAVFGAVAPLLEERSSLRGRIGSALRPIGWLALGMIVVSGLYGAIGAAAGDGLPQLSTATTGGVPVRLIQSSVVFGVIGVAFCYLGLAAVKVVPDPIARIEGRFSNARNIVMGVLIGGFLIGRPYPLFHKMFAYAAAKHDPFYGAAVFILQSLGNIVVMVVLVLLLTVGTGGRVPAWLTARPGRAASVIAATFLIAGAFLVVYWDVRLPAHFGYGWFPTTPWA